MRQICRWMEAIKFGKFCGRLFFSKFLYFFATFRRSWETALQKTLKFMLSAPLAQEFFIPSEGPDSLDGVIQDLNLQVCDVIKSCLLCQQKNDK